MARTRMVFLPCLAVTEIPIEEASLLLAKLVSGGVVTWSTVTTLLTFVL